MHKFIKGDKVRVIDLDLLDEAMGIKVGDIFVVMEDDTVPCCRPLTENPMLEEEMDEGLWALDEDQLELVEEE